VVAVAVQGLMCSRQIEQGPDQSRPWRSTVGYWRRWSIWFPIGGQYHSTVCSRYTYTLEYLYKQDGF